MFWSQFIFHGHSTQEPASSKVNYFILRAYKGTGVSHSQHRKNSGKVLGKTMQVNGLEGWKLARKKSQAVSVACMAIYRLTPGFRRTFKLCVLNRQNFNFCVPCSPMREYNNTPRTFGVKPELKSDATAIYVF